MKKAIKIISIGILTIGIGFVSFDFVIDSVTNVEHDNIYQEELEIENVNSNVALSDIKSQADGIQMTIDNLLQSDTLSYDDLIFELETQALTVEAMNSKLKITVYENEGMQEEDDINQISNHFNSFVNGIFNINSSDSTTDIIKIAKQYDDGLERLRDYEM